MKNPHTQQLNKLMLICFLIMTGSFRASLGPAFLVSLSIDPALTGRLQSEELDENYRDNPEFHRLSQQNAIQWNESVRFAYWARAVIGFVGSVAALIIGLYILRYRTPGAYLFVAFIVLAIGYMTYLGIDAGIVRAGGQRPIF
jgi:hypothetical protein